jgi:hypothetical protein
MLEKSKFEYRMYGFVPYQLSGIQSGIQFGHAVVEYQLKFGKTAEYEKWSKQDKTFIVLDGGTTNDNPYRLGSLNKITTDLSELGLKYVTFREPDLGDQITSVVFLLDERVWDKEKYPYDPNETPEIILAQLNNISVSILEASSIIDIRNFIGKYRLKGN